MAYLQIREGGGEGRRFDLPESGDLVLGRLASSGVELDHPSVSSRHCILSKDGGRYRIRDLDSTNGTRINGELVAEAPVHRGDVISLGELQMALLGDDVAEAPRSVAIPEPIAARRAASAPASDAAPVSADVPQASAGPQFKPLTPASASSANLPKAFQKKPRHNRLWVVGIVMALALAVFLTVMLFRQMP